MAELNGLEVCTADVSRAFLQLKCKEKVWTCAGIDLEESSMGESLL